MGRQGCIEAYSEALGATMLELQLGVELMGAPMKPARERITLCIAVGREFHPVDAKITVEVTFPPPDMETVAVALTSLGLLEVPQISAIAVA